MNEGLRIHVRLAVCLVGFIAAAIIHSFRMPIFCPPGQSTTEFGRLAVIVIGIWLIIRK
jgi:hypothetical protein